MEVARKSGQQRRLPFCAAQVPRSTHLATMQGWLRQVQVRLLQLQLARLLMTQTAARHLLLKVGLV